MIKIFIIPGIVLFIAWIFKQPVVKGKFGEWVVALCLKFGLNRNTYRILNNIMIPDDVGGTSQIDHIVLTPYGIFVIETKNMKGWIFGDKNSSKWTQQIFKCKNQFQNPFRQNYKHIMCLADLTGLPKESFTHIIVFVGDCQIKTRNKLPKSLVTGGISLLNFIKEFSEKQFTADELNAIQKAIISNRISNTFQNKKVHIAHVKEIIGTKDPLVPVCPKCGTNMIRRQAKSGADSGKYFWGCSNYPQCHAKLDFRDFDVSCKRK